MEGAGFAIGKMQAVQRPMQDFGAFRRACTLFGLKCDVSKHR